MRSLIRRLVLWALADPAVVAAIREHAVRGVAERCSRDPGYRMTIDGGASDLRAVSAVAAVALGRRDGR